MDAKSQLEGLEVLRKAAWDSFEGRRKYEWRISISFWTMLVSFIVAVVTEKMPHKLSCYLALFPVLLSVAHCLWINGLFGAYSRDKRAEGFYRKAMREILGIVESEYEASTLELSVEQLRKKGAWYNWNARSQLLTTITLTLLAVYVVIAN